MLTQSNTSTFLKYSIKAYILYTINDMCAFELLKIDVSARVLDI